MTTNSVNKFALILSGGGARGAYQVGVVAAINEIFKQSSIEPKFHFYTGVSAGAINAGFMAANCENFSSATQRLVELWSRIHSDEVFYTDAINLSRIGMKWMSELSLGGLTGTTGSRALLDTAPLRELIGKNLDLKKIAFNLENSHLDGVAISAVDYQSSRSVSFVQGQAQLPSWNKYRRHSEKTEIEVSHIMASAAIPMLFPPVQVDTRYFGDGCVRNTNPCGPSIYMGANKLVIIGVRKQGGTLVDQSSLLSDKAPSVARVINVLLNAVLLDGVELDVERLQKVNSFIQQIPPQHRGSLVYKPIDYVWISPSVDIGELAISKATQLPRMIRYLLKGLGSIEDAAEIVSYLLFDPGFCSQLIEIGYADGMNQKDELVKLFSAEK